MSLRILDRGHIYVLEALDGEFNQVLQFVKREGPNYPGNVGHHPGTTTQAVLRCLIERIQYVNNQIPDYRNDKAIELLREVILLFEQRAAERHGKILLKPEFPIETYDTAANGHIENLWKDVKS